MKIMHHRDGRVPWSEGSSPWIAGCVACFVIALSGPSWADGPADDGSGGGSGGAAAGGDETVGTLPIIGGQNIRLPMALGWRGSRPAFYLEGTAADLSSAILWARGTGFVTIETVGNSSDIVRAAFHGDVSVVLDRDLMGALPIQTGIAVPSSYGPRRASLALGTGAVRTTPLRAGLLRLAVGELSTANALDGNPLQVRTTGNGGRVTTDRIFATPDVLILRQSY